MRIAIFNIVLTKSKCPNSNQVLRKLIQKISIYLFTSNFYKIQ